MDHSESGNTFFRRTHEVDIFRSRLSQPLDERHRFAILNIWGLDGVGKSTLLDKYKNIRGRDSAWAEITSFDDDLPTLLYKIAFGLKKQGIQLQNFISAYRKWNSEGKATQPLNLSMLKTANALMGLINPPVGAVIEASGGLALNLVERINKQKIIPIETLELEEKFYNDLLKQSQTKKIIIAIDNYDETPEFFVKRLAEQARVMGSKQKIGITFVIASRKPINNDLSWVNAKQFILDVPLEPFTREETFAFCSYYKITTDSNTQKAIYKTTGGLPLYLRALVGEEKFDASALSKFSEITYDFYVKQVETPEERWMILLSAIPRAFNLDTITAMFGEKNARVVFDRLKTYPFIRRNRSIEGIKQLWELHPLVRSQFLLFSREQSKKDWFSFHKKLSDYYEKLLLVNSDGPISKQEEEHYRQELLYHRCCLSHEQNIKYAIEIILESIFNKWGLNPYISALNQAEKDSETAKVACWGEKFLKSTSDDFSTSFAGRFNLYEELLNFPDLDPKIAAELYYYHSFNISLSLIGISSLKILNEKMNVPVDINKIAQRTIGLLDKAIQIQPNNPKYLQALGKVYLEIKEYSIALSHLQLALQNKNDDVSDIHVEIAGCYAGLQDKENALKHFQLAIDLNPNNPKYYLSMGNYYGEIGENSLAIDCCTMGISKDPKNQSLYFHRAQLYSTAKMYDLALQDLESVIAFSNEKLIPLFNWFAYSLRPDVFIGLQRYDEAIKDLNYLIENASDFEFYSSKSRNLWLRSLCYKKIGKLREAKTDLRLALEIDPKNLNSLNQLAEFHQDERHYKKALEIYNRIFSINTNFVPALLSRSTLYTQLGKFELAIKDCTRVIELDPSDEMFFGRAFVYFLNNQYDLALYDLNKISIASIKNAQFYNIRGISFLNLQNYSFAVEDFTKSLEMDNFQPHIYFYRSICFNRLGNEQRALEDMNEFAVQGSSHTGESPLSFLQNYLAKLQK